MRYVLPHFVLLQLGLFQIGLNLFGQDGHDLAVEGVQLAELGGEFLGVVIFEDVDDGSFVFVDLDIHH